MTEPDAGRSEAAELSKLLFEARELIDMLGDIVERQSGRSDAHSCRVRDEIDTFREARGWSPHGFGGESAAARTQP